jgi:Tfp pilus assembly protein PilF
VHHALASVLDDAGRTDEAIRHLEKAVELDPGQIVFHLGLADLFAKKGEPERAREHLEKAMALDPR